MVAAVGFTRFKKGTRIVICLKDGQRVRGEYVGAHDGAVAIATCDPTGRAGTLIMPKKAIAFMRADGS